MDFFNDDFEGVIEDKSEDEGETNTNSAPSIHSVSMSRILANSIKHTTLQEPLESLGFAVIDHAFGTKWANAIRSEILQLKELGMMQEAPNRILAQSGEAYVLPKKNVFELDFTVDGKVCQEKAFNLSPTIRQFWENERGEVVDILNKAFPGLQLEFLDTLKVCEADRDFHFCTKCPF
jgi:hypothetical protein